MGMYTDIIFKGKLKKEFIEIWKKYIDSNDETNLWVELNKIVNNEKLKILAESERGTFFMWCENELKKEEMVNDEGVVKIQSSWKNYESEAEKFYDILGLVFEEVYEYKTHYEENFDWDENDKRYEEWFNHLTQKDEKIYDNTQSNEKPCKDKECDYYDVNYPKNCSTSPCSKEVKK